MWDKGQTQREGGACACYRRECRDTGEALQVQGRQHQGCEHRWGTLRTKAG